MRRSRHYGVKREHAYKILRMKEKEDGVWRKAFLIIRFNFAEHYIIQENGECSPLEKHSGSTFDEMEFKTPRIVSSDSQYLNKWVYFKWT